MFLEEKQNTSDYQAQGALEVSRLLVVALNGKEAVAWVLVNDKTFWQFVYSFWTFVLAEVVDCLLFTTTECYLL
jgi:hypothetical protein